MKNNRIPTAQEAILKVVSVFDEGNKEMEEVLEVYGMHSLKAGELISRIEKSIMFRVGQIVRSYEEGAEVLQEPTLQNDTSQGSRGLGHHHAK